MDPLLAGFIRRLRRDGLAVSPAEAIDAARAALLVGLESRARFRWAMRGTLAKTLEAQGIFDAAFDSHFAAPRPPAGRRRGKGREPGDGPGPARRGEGESTGKGRMARERPERRPRERRHPVAGETPRRAGDPGRSRPARAGRDTGPRGRILAASRREAANARGPGTAREIRRRDFAEPLTQGDEGHMAAAIASIIREIRLKPGRRHRPGRRGRLWVKRMIRESLSRGGVPFTLPARTRRPRRPRVVILLDVSWSVARAAALFLLICRGLAERVGRVRVHLFVDRMVEATREVELWARGRVSGSPPGRPGRRPFPGGGIRPAPGCASFADLVDGLPELNPSAPSDYGRAFHQAAARWIPGSGRDTVLIVLGDARSNRRDPLPWAFQEIAGRCRRVLWLNPEPRDRWDSGDSVMESYLPFCDVVCEVRDLDGLARGVREMMRSL